ncbi:MAG: hypothetical protein JKX73_09305 [Flavobacteriales bacterium]|nr:hypothetical protein [Flavobacteriales bacterium]
MKLKAIPLIVLFLVSGQVMGQRTNVVGNILLHIKSYQEGDRENESGFAADAKLDVVNIETGDAVDMTSKYGIFKTNLAIGQNYMVQVSKPGFETKSIIITTRGANSGFKYLLRFDFYLQQKGYALYSQKHPVVCVVHNHKHQRFDLTDCLHKTKAWRL